MEEQKRRPFYNHFIVFATVSLMSIAVSCVHNYQRNGKDYSSVKKEQAVSSCEDTKTGYTWKDSNGKVYDIYISEKGACYIYRTSSKTGNQYKSYLPKEITLEIRKEIMK